MLGSASDPGNQLLGPGDPDPGANPSLKRQAGPGAAGRLIKSAELPGKPGEQAVDGPAAVRAGTHDGELARSGDELAAQPVRVGDAQFDGDLGPVGDRLDTGP